MAFDIQIATDENFADIVESNSVEETAYQGPVLPYSTQHYWRIRQDAGNWVSRNFTVQADPDADSDSITGDHLTLVALFEATHEEGTDNAWKNTTGWPGTPETMGDMYGVEVWSEQDAPDASFIGRVRSIKLNGTTGWIVPYLRGQNGVAMEVSDGVTTRNPPHANITQRGGNNLYGELISVPFGNLKKCQYINLMNNHLFGPLPWSEIYAMEEAVMVLLNGLVSDPEVDSPHTQYNISKHDGNHATLLERTNTFTGTWDNGIGVMKKLRCIQCAGRDGSVHFGLTGPMPSDIGQCESLNQIGVGYNGLTSIADFSGAPITNLRINRQTTQPHSGGTNDFPAMAGINANNEINAWLQNVTTLYHIHYGLNDVGGDLFDIRNSPNITGYNTGSSNHGGVVPEYLLDGTLPNLNLIGVGDNNLTGTLPEASESLDLRLFTCGSNDLEGPIPHSHFRPKLAGTQWRRNRLSGVIRRDLRFMYRLKQFRPNENDFEGGWAVFDFAEDFEFYYDLAFANWTEIDSGDATSGDANTLTDTGKNWTVDEHAGKWCRYKSAMHDDRGPQRKIISNTSDTLILRSEYDIETEWPSVEAGDYYEIGTVSGENAFSGGNSLEQIEMHLNHYVFRDMLIMYEGKTLLEWYKEKATRSWRYTPQKPFGPKPFGELRTVEAEQGGTLIYDELEDYVSHPDNVYLWERQSGSIKGGVTTNSSDIIINDFQPSDEGLYRLRVTNPGAVTDDTGDELTLFSEYINFSITTTEE